MKFEQVCDFSSKICGNPRPSDSANQQLAGTPSSGEARHAVSRPRSGVPFYDRLRNKYTSFLPSFLVTSASTTPLPSVSSGSWPDTPLHTPLSTPSDLPSPGINAVDVISPLERRQSHQECQCRLCSNYQRLSIWILPSSNPGFAPLCLPDYRIERGCSALYCIGTRVEEGAPQVGR